MQPNPYAYVSVEGLLKGEIIVSKAASNTNDVGLMFLYALLSEIGLKYFPVQTFKKVGEEWGFIEMISFSCELFLQQELGEKPSLKKIFNRMTRSQTHYYWEHQDYQRICRDLPRGSRGVLFFIGSKGAYFQGCKEMTGIVVRNIPALAIGFGEWIRYVAQAHGRFINPYWSYDKTLISAENPEDTASLNRVCKRFLPLASLDMNQDPVIN